MTNGIPPREHGQPTLLDRLRSGDIDEQRYIELHIQDAMEPLQGLLPVRELELIRADLHDLVEHDPWLSGLVRTAHYGPR